MITQPTAALPLTQAYTDWTETVTERRCQWRRRLSHQVTTGRPQQQPRRRGRQSSYVPLVAARPDTNHGNSAHAQEYLHNLPFSQEIQNSLINKRGNATYHRMRDVLLLRKQPVSVHRTIHPSSHCPLSQCRAKWSQGASHPRNQVSLGIILVMSLD